MRQTKPLDKKPWHWPMMYPGQVSSQPAPVGCASSPASGVEDCANVQSPLEAGGSEFQRCHDCMKWVDNCDFPECQSQEFRRLHALAQPCVDEGSDLAYCRDAELRWVRV